MRQCLLLLIPANALESGKPGHYNPLAGTGFPKHPVVILFWHPPSPHMAEEKREEGGRTCVQRELSSRAAACWFMFMFMLACWLVVVSILVIPIASHNDKRLFQLSVVGRKLSAVS